MVVDCSLVVLSPPVGDIVLCWTLEVSGSSLLLLLFVLQCSSDGTRADLMVAAAVSRLGRVMSLPIVVCWLLGGSHLFSSPRL